jgi:hypothetical protein
MKKILGVFVLVAITLTGCISIAQLRGNTYSYSHKLTGDNITDNLYEDNDLKISFSVGTKEIDFEIYNKTDKSIKIIWDETSFIPYGEGKKVMHKGVKYVDRNAAQVPTTIPSKTSWSDMVVPTDNVYYKQGYYSQYVSNPGGWETTDLWLTADFNKPETEAVVMKLKGLKYRLLMPMEVNGIKKEYTFNFEITDVVKTAPPATN